MRHLTPPFLPWLSLVDAYTLCARMSLLTQAQIPVCFFYTCQLSTSLQRHYWEIYKLLECWGFTVARWRFFFLLFSPLWHQFKPVIPQHSPRFLPCLILCMLVEVLWSMLLSDVEILPLRSLLPVIPWGHNCHLKVFIIVKSLLGGLLKATTSIFTSVWSHSITDSAPVTCWMPLEALVFCWNKCK